MQSVQATRSFLASCAVMCAALLCVAAGPARAEGSAFEGVWIGATTGERVVDLVDSAKFTSRAASAVLVLENESPGTVANALARQRELQDYGTDVRLELRPKKLNLLLETLGKQGFDKFAVVDETTTSPDALSLKDIG